MSHYVLTMISSKILAFIFLNLKHQKGIYSTIIKNTAAFATFRTPRQDLLDLEFVKQALSHSQFSTQEKQNIICYIWNMFQSDCRNSFCDIYSQLQLKTPRQHSVFVTFTASSSSKHQGSICYIFNLLHWEHYNRICYI